MIRARGIQVLSADAIVVARTITNEVIRLITEADFIAVLIGTGPQAAVAYELGIAQGLGKPAFVVFDGSPSLEPANAYVVSIAKGEAIENIIGDLDLFVRNAKRRSTPNNKPKTEAGHSLDWAREKLAALRRKEGRDRYQAFEELCAEIFRAANVEVEHVGQGRQAQDLGADFVVWLNDIAFELGGPTLVECKFYGGSAGSIIKNSEHTVRRIEAVMDRSAAKLALLVYDHDHSYSPPSLFETPRVLSFAIDDVIQAIERQDLERTILKRRERALFAGSPQ